VAEKDIESDDPESDVEPTGTSRRRKGPRLTPEQQAKVDAEAVALGRFLPAGMVAGAVVGVLAGWITHRFGICIPVGVALGILVAGTLPLFRSR